MSYQKMGSVAMFPKMQASPSRFSKLNNDPHFKVSLHPTTMQSHSIMGPSGRPTMTTARKMPSSLFNASIDTQAYKKNS